MSEKSVIGACRFCGQTKMITLSEGEWLDRIRETNLEAVEIADDITTEECDCKAGSDWRADHYVMQQCRENIESMFKDEYEVVANMLQEGVEPVYAQTIKRLTIVTPENGIATMTRSGGNLKVKFTQKHETELTASY